MDDPNKWASRKLLVTLLCLILGPSLPILYKAIGISNEVTMTVEGIIAAVMSVYGISNVVAKKYGGEP